MPRKRHNLAEALIRAPWWVSIVFGIFLAGAIMVVPAIAFSNPVLHQAFARSAPILAGLAMFFCVVLSGVSFIHGRKRARLVDQQTDIDSLRRTSWKDFEFMVAEAYRRQGYSVDFSLGGGADGGVDLVLQKGGVTTLVQCKQWKSLKVGAPIVRELIGAMTVQCAARGIVVTAGDFTREGRELAAAQSVELVDGPRLLELIRSVQKTPADTTQAVEPTAITRPPPPEIPEGSSVPTCPKCGSPMKQRTARRGANSGAAFWGCSRYPECHGTRNA
jgi:restriction system protein